MSATLKSMFKKQISRSVGRSEDDSEKDNWTLPRKEPNDAVVLRKKVSRRRQSSLGALEDIIKCPICKQILKLPRMLTCQHTFCKKCLEVKLEETTNANHKGNALRCPVCQKTTEHWTPNLSIESVLRAVDGNFIEERIDKTRSLVVNFAPLTSEQRRKNNVRCVKCETTCDDTDFCQHCNQVFCKVCQALHTTQLKDQLKVIIEQLQVTTNKLEHRVQDFKVKTDSLKELITKEYDAKIAALNEEREKKLESIDEFRMKGINSAEDIRQRILDSQVDLIKQKDCGFDCIDDDKEKVVTFLELHRKATEIISSALTWQSKLDDTIEMKNGEITRIRDKEHKIFHRPRLVSERKDLQRPSGLAVDSKRGDIYVACPGSGQLVVFDRQFRILRRIQNPSMMAPQSVAYVDSVQEIFVTDKWKHAVFVFNRKGQLIRSYGEKGQGDGQLRCPEGIDVLRSRNWIYIADTGNDRIQIIGIDGSYKGGIGPNEKPNSKMPPRIAGIHNFNQPTDVAVSNNAIVVADCGHHKIKVFNHKGQLMFSIGGFGIFKGLLKSPEVVKLDENGNIIVGDSDNSRVQIFSPQGTFLRSFGNQGTAVGQFGWISGLLCLPNNDILVADSKNNTGDSLSIMESLSKESLLHFLKLKKNIDVSMVLKKPEMIYVTFRKKANEEAR